MFSWCRNLSPLKVYQSLLNESDPIKTGPDRIGHLICITASNHNRIGNLIRITAFNQNGSGQNWSSDPYYSIQSKWTMTELVIWSVLQHPVKTNHVRIGHLIRISASSLNGPWQNWSSDPYFSIQSKWTMTELVIWSVLQHPIEIGHDSLQQPIKPLQPPSSNP